MFLPSLSPMLCPPSSHPHTMQALALRPLQEVWLMVPSISRFQWHPFTVAGGSADGVLTLHVKRYGPFTKVSGRVLTFWSPQPSHSHVNCDRPRNTAILPLSAVGAAERPAPAAAHDCACGWAHWLRDTSWLSAAAICKLGAA